MCLHFETVLFSEVIFNPLPPLFFSSIWSTSMTFFCNMVEEVDIKRVLKSSIFVVQKATAPKTGVEFRQGSIGAIRSSLATSYDVWRRCAMSQLYFEKNLHTNGLTDGHTEK